MTVPFLRILEAAPLPAAALLLPLVDSSKRCRSPMRLRLLTCLAPPVTTFPAYSHMPPARPARCGHRAALMRLIKGVSGSSGSRALQQAPTVRRAGRRQCGPPGRGGPGLDSRAGAPGGPHRPGTVAQNVYSSARPQVQRARRLKSVKACAGSGSALRVVLAEGRGPAPMRRRCHKSADAHRLPQRRCAQARERAAGCCLLHAPTPTNKTLVRATSSTGRTRTSNATLTWSLLFRWRHSAQAFSTTD